MQWKDVFNSSHKWWGGRDRARTAALDAGYKFFSWNDRIYTVDTCSDTDVPIEYIGEKIMATIHGVCDDCGRQGILAYNPIGRLVCAGCSGVSAPVVFMWEILVPVNDAAGKKIPIKRHKSWDSTVLHVATGMTLYRVAKGTWTHPSTQKIIEESMIPVRIVCSRENVLKIAQFTKKHYNQHTVMVYQVSQDVITV